MPLHLKKSINQAHLEKGTYKQTVSHLEQELQLNELEAPEELQLNTVTQQATQQNSKKPKPTCHHCKKPGYYRNQCCQIKREKTGLELTRIVPTIATKTMVVVKKTLTPTVKFPTVPTQTIQT